MGRYYYNSKATADESLDVSIYRLRRLGVLAGCVSTIMKWVRTNSGKESYIRLSVDITDEPYARFLYTVTDKEGNETKYDYEVSLVTTPCTFGGVRYWFGCPDCGRRVGVLYLARGDVRFRCRHCNNLSYWSRNRCIIGTFGHTSRQIDQLRGEIKRWTWRGRPTRKVRRLQALERKMEMLSGPIMAGIEKLTARLR